jgi:hypothetical protein
MGPDPIARQSKERHMAKGIRIDMAHHPQTILDTMETMEKDAHAAKWQWNLGCGFSLVMVGLGVLAYFLDSSLDYGPVLAVLAYVLWALAAIAGVVLLLNKPRFPREQLEPVRQILYTLRDDTGRKGWVAGWLDMTGPQQKTKQIRTARSAGGKTKVYYRDPWFRARLKLVDGNVLCLVLEDKVKTKAGSVVNHRTQFTAKLIVSPELYRVGTAPVDGSTSHVDIYSAGDGVLNIKTEVDPHRLPVDHMLESLKAMYSYLEPLQPINRLESSISDVET